MKTSLVLRLAVFACLLTVVPAFAKDKPAAGGKPPKKAKGAATMPTGESILDRYVTVTGGKEAYAKIHSQLAQGTWEMAPIPPGQLIEKWTAPRNYVKRIDLSVGVVENGVRDSVAWQRLPGQPPALLQGDERLSSIAEAELFTEPAWRTHFKNVRLAGVDTVEARPAYKVEATEASGRVRTCFYDRESGLLVKRLSPGPTPDAPPVTQTLSDYREVSGVKIPFRIITQLGAQKFTKQYASIELNVDLGAQEFAPPDGLEAHDH